MSTETRCTAPLPASALRRALDPTTLAFATTADVEPLDGMIGQPRAAESLALALELGAPGYNVFATGPPGVGKRSVLEAELRRRAAERPAPCDWVYLHDFAAPTRPAAVALPGGRAAELAADVQRLVDEVRAELDAALESDTYRDQHHALHERQTRRRDELLAALRETAAARGVAIELTPAGILTTPMADGQRVSREEFLALPEERQRAYHAALTSLQTSVEDTFRRLQEIERVGREEHRQLTREVALAAIGPLIAERRDRWRVSERLQGWFDAVLTDMLDHLDALRDGPDATGGAPAPVAAGPLQRYAVNAFVSRNGNGGAPVVSVHDCTYYELFGRIDYETAFGAAVTDHRHLRPGAVHEAAGGYLLLEARDVLAKPFVWGRLKELLRTGQARIENLGTQFMLFPSASLDPEPIDVDLTVVLVGSTELYALLHALDDDVPRLFKIRADFDGTAPWDDRGIAGYAAFVSRQVADHGLAPFARDAVARLVEHGARLAGDAQRLSTRYPEIADIVMEAAHEAGRSGAAAVAAEHVEAALRNRRRRSDLPEQWLRRATLEGTLRVDVGDAATGQVNGLAVAYTGDVAFGHPMRVSATVAPGPGDVVDIDREAELSGPVHDKGVLILAGLLRHLYCREVPLALRASLVFEQSYGPVEGDSASAAELFAVVSALADAPLDQHLAVTGSVDQRGAIQAIGGVNEKIEGFFALCRERGLDGRHGVVIPAANVRHLMLAPEVVAAVAEGAFNVWPIATIDDGLELLTGLSASELHARAQSRIAEFAALARDFQGPRERER